MHVKWPSIESFHHVCTSVDKAKDEHGLPVPMYRVAHSYSIAYRPKIKLHGTNAGITIKKGGDVFAQSRTSIIGTGNDNMQFAAWVEETKDHWETRVNSHGLVTTVFGEWCGFGIQKGAAICQLDRKIFAIFGLQIGDKIYIEPSDIEYHLGGLPENTYIIPWAREEETSIFYTKKDSLIAFVDKANALIEDIDACDPWVKEKFNIEGTGEGLVWYPVSLADNQGLVERDVLSAFMFKTKGEKHKVVKSKKAVQIEPEVAASIDDFVDMVVTEARLEQGAREINRGELEFEQRLIGPFIGWIGKDVHKECGLELTASELEWSQVTKAVTTKARTWYLNKMKEF